MEARVSVRTKKDVLVGCREVYGRIRAVRETAQECLTTVVVRTHRIAPHECKIQV